MGNCSSTHNKHAQSQNTMLVTKRHEYVKDKQFTPIKMSVLYECDDEELPETTSIREFGDRLHKFVCQRHADEIDNHLTLYDCYKVGGFISCSTGKNAGLIPLRSIKGDNCQLAVAWVLELRDQCPELKINKKSNKIYTWLIEGEVFIDHSTNTELLVLYEDEEYHYTLNFPVMSFSLIRPHVHPGQRINPKQFKPIHKTYGIIGTHQHTEEQEDNKCSMMTTFIKFAGLGVGIGIGIYAAIKTERFLNKSSKSASPR